MTGKIYHSLFLSIFFHSLFVLFLIFGIRNSIYDFKNLTYVTLIQEKGNSSTISTVIQDKNELKEPEEAEQKKEIHKKISKISKSDVKLLQERLAALQAKKRILEKAGEGALEVTGQKNINGEDVGYLATISGLIRQNWNIPDTVPKNLEAIVSVRILYNGQIIIEGFEKNSGNALFDSSVIKAIRNSSPLPPPKNELRVGLRFRP